MATTIRLTRMGRKKRPFYRLVVLDSRKRRDGAYLANLGYYNPFCEPAEVVLNDNDIIEWLTKGATISDTARSLLRQEGVLYKYSLIKDGVDGADLEAKVAEWRQNTETKAAARIEAAAAKKAAAKAEAEAAAKAEAEAEAAAKAEAEAAAKAEKEAAAAAKAAEEAAAKAEEEAAAAAEAPAEEATGEATGEAATEAVAEVAEEAPAAEAAEETKKDEAEDGEK